MTADLLDEGIALNPGVGGSTIAVEAVPSQVASTTIAALSNGLSLPQATINVTSTAGFPASGVILVTTSSGTYAVTYTGVSSSTQFTGCSGGAGVMATGGAVVSGAFVEVMKLLLGADGKNDGYVAAANPLPAQITDGISKASVDALNGLAVRTDYRVQKRFDLTAGTTPGSIQYIGYAKLGVLSSAASWTINKITFVAGNPTQSQWTAELGAVWDNRATETYS